jgi:hypothetical protein
MNSEIKQGSGMFIFGIVVVLAGVVFVRLTAPPPADHSTVNDALFAAKMDRLDKWMDEVDARGIGQFGDLCDKRCGDNCACIKGEPCPCSDRWMKPSNDEAAVKPTGYLVPDCCMVRPGKHGGMYIRKDSPEKKSKSQEVAGGN